jgi:hypothetical protein
MKPSKQMHWVRNALIAVGILVIGYGFAPKRSSDPVRSWVLSMGNLHTLRDGLWRYAGEHEGRLPSTLSALAPKQVDADLLSRIRYVVPDTGPRILADWIYYARPTLSESPPETILVAAPTADQLNRRLVLRADGNVTWLDEAAFQSQAAGQATTPP